MKPSMEADCIEYIDGLTSVELAMMMAIKYSESPHHAARRCARKVSKRLRTPTVRMLFKNLSVHPSCIEVITSMRSKLDCIV